MASRSLGTLTLDLVARVGGFTSALSKAERDAQKRFKGIENAAQKMGYALGAAISAAGAATVIGVKSAIDYADKLNDMNIRLGVSAEALSGWGYAAKQSGTDIDALGVGLKKLAKNMAEALDPNSTQGRLFEGLGVSVTDASGKLKSVETILPEIANKFKELNNASLESAIAMDLFGRSGTDLLEFLNQGEDGLSDLRDRARELGVELSSSTLKSADEFNDTLGDIKTIVDGLWAQLAAALLPVLVDVAKQLRNGAKDGGEFGSIFGFIADQARAALKDIAFFIKTARELKALYDSFGDEKAQERSWLPGAQDYYKTQHMFDNVQGGAQTTQRIGRFSPEYEKASLNFNPGASDLEKRLLRSYGPTDSANGGRKSGGKSDAEREAEQLQAAYDRMNASLTQQIALFGQDGQAAKLRYELEHGELSKLTQAQKEHLIALAEQSDQQERMKATQDATVEALAREKDAVESVLLRLDDERAALNLSNVELEKRNALLGLSAQAQAEWGDKIGKSIEELDAMRKQADFIDGVRHEFNNFFMDVFTGTKSIKDAFTDLFDSIAAMITQKIVEGWLDKLFGSLGTTGSGTKGGDFFSSILGFFGFGGANANGNAFMGGSIVPFANGGVVTAPQLFPMSGGRTGLMGEAGPEAIMPLKRGPDGKLGVRMHGGGGVSQTFVVQGRMDYRTADQVARQSGVEARRAITRSGG